jgi:CBS-domain-containing membrane protein
MRKHTHRPFVIHWDRTLIVTIGVTLAVGMAGLISDLTHCMLIATSLGASSFLLFGFPDSAFAQPRNFLGGYLVTALVGLVLVHLLGTAWWAVAAATGAATAVMMITDTVHPPAASNPLIIASMHPGWSFLVFPDFGGGLLVLATALIFHRLNRKPYPLYWI